MKRCRLDSVRFRACTRCLITIYMKINVHHPIFYSYRRMSEHIAARGKINLATFKGLPSSPQGKTITEEFLSAAEDVIEMMSNFGAWMRPVTNDMKNNVNQIQNYYSQDMENRKYIEEMVYTDLERKILLQLLWLCRSLEFCIKFLIFVASEKDIVCEKSNDVRPCIKRAYNEVLKPYHGFFLQKTFSVS